MNPYTELAEGVSRSSVKTLEYIDLRNTSTTASLEVTSNFVQSNALLILLSLGLVIFFMILAYLLFKKDSSDI